MAKSLAEHDGPFDLIYIDPPYASGLQERTLEVIMDCGLLTERGTVIVEHDARTTLPSNLDRLQRTDDRRYGETRLSFYQLTGR